jgi:hypothetical protein
VNLGWQICPACHRERLSVGLMEVLGETKNDDQLQKGKEG